MCHSCDILYFSCPPCLIHVNPCVFHVHATILTSGLKRRGPGAQRHREWNNGEKGGASIRVCAIHAQADLPTTKLKSYSSPHIGTYLLRGFGTSLRTSLVCLGNTLKNGMEWIELEWDGIDMNGMKSNGMEWTGRHGMEWIGKGNNINHTRNIVSRLLC